MYVNESVSRHKQGRTADHGYTFVTAAAGDHIGSCWYGSLLDCVASRTLQPFQRFNASTALQYTFYHINLRTVSQAEQCAIFENGRSLWIGRGPVYGFS